MDSRSSAAPCRKWRTNASTYLVILVSADYAILCPSASSILPPDLGSGTSFLICFPRHNSLTRILIVRRRVASLALDPRHSTRDSKLQYYVLTVTWTITSPDWFCSESAIAGIFGHKNDQILYNDIIFARYGNCHEKVTLCRTSMMGTE